MAIETRGVKPLYGKRMTRILRTPLSDSHWATLTLAATVTGRTRAGIVRESLERYLPELLSQPRVEPEKRDGRIRSGSHPKKTKRGQDEGRASGKQVDDSDSSTAYRAR
jgi:hypothetical protein